MNQFENKPSVSLIMPCLNEESFIENAIKSLINDYFRENCELIIVDGMSKDGTRNIIQSLMNRGLPIKLIDNSNTLQVFGINKGIQASNGNIIVRTDAHCLYPPNYIRNCVSLLNSTGATNAGGVMLPQGQHSVQNAIALAMQHPVGVGDAKFHLGNFKGYVDTVFLGTFRKKTLDEIGLFDVKAHPNEDAELNLRLLKANKKIYLDSSIKVTYFPRETLKDLGIQYFKYGQGRCYTVLKHKKITSLRQVLPVALVLLLAVTIISSIFYPLFLIIPLLYIVSLLSTAFLSWSNRNIPFKERFLMGVAWGVMHICWGFGFLSNFFYKRSPRHTR